MFVYFGYIIPLGVLIILNLAIIFKATRFSRSQRQQNQQRRALSSIVSCLNNKRKLQMTRMILFITFLYVIISLPGIIVTGWLFVPIMSLDSGVLIVNSLNSVLFSYPALNFFTLLAINKLFAKEARSTIFELFKKPKRNPTASNNTNFWC